MPNTRCAAKRMQPETREGGCFGIERHFAVARMERSEPAVMQTRAGAERGAVRRDRGSSSPWPTAGRSSVATALFDCIVVGI